MLPEAGTPQELGGTASIRWRTLYPASHLLARHAVQTPQSVQAPLMHDVLQLWMLQGSTSFLSPTSQSAPPIGITIMVRQRRLLPPPHVRVHPPQLLQSAHKQSTTLSQLPAFPTHGLISLIAPRQPWCSLRGPFTARSRFLTPAPQSWVQSLHSAHIVNSHTGPPKLLGHASVLHARVDTRFEAGNILPWLPPLSTSRHRNSWPPPQETEQPCQAFHAEILPLAPFPCGHPDNSLIESEHGTPLPMASLATLRVRVLCVGVVASHPAQAVQSESAQSWLAWQGPVLQ